MASIKQLVTYFLNTVSKQQAHTLIYSNILSKYKHK